MCVGQTARQYFFACPPKYFKTKIATTSENICYNHLIKHPCISPVIMGAFSLLKSPPQKCRKTDGGCGR